MNLQAMQINSSIVLEGPHGAPLLHSLQDVSELISSCWEHNSQLLLLYGDNLTPRFFDLSSGEAGEILQKLRNYGIRLAAVVDAARTPQSTRFRELLSDERRGEDFRLFEDRAAAEAWLLRARV